VGSRRDDWVKPVERENAAARLADVLARINDHNIQRPEQVSRHSKAPATLAA
jgi:hypothetical protein